MNTRFYTLLLILCAALSSCSGFSEKKEKKTQVDNMTLKTEKVDSLLQTMNSDFEFQTIEYTEDPKTSTPEKVIKSDPKKTYMLTNMSLSINEESIRLMDNRKKVIDVFTLTKKTGKKSTFSENSTLYWVKLKATNKMGLSTDIWFIYLADSMDETNSKLVNMNIKYKYKWTEIEWFLSKN